MLYSAFFLGGWIRCCGLGFNQMNVHKKRSWLVRLFRLPSSAEQKVSNLYHRIPAPVRFWIYFSLLVLSTAFLIVNDSLAILDSLKRVLGMSRTAHAYIPVQSLPVIAAAEQVHHG